MNITDKLKEFMAFIYDKYKQDETFSMSGNYIEVLIDESGIDFEDLSNQAIFEQLRERKWIKYKSHWKYSNIGSEIIPTAEGLKIVEEMRQKKNPIMKIAPDIVELSGRFFKGFKGN
jgi:hypothetical protein